MTKENLLRYLRDPEYLHQISYQELKTLVAEHPNSYTLRHLLAVKSRQEGNNDYLRQKEFAALYSIDRPHLFDVLTKAEILEALPDGVLLQEDYLELKELSALEKELSMTSIGGSAVASAAIAATVLADTPQIPPSRKPSPAIEFEEEELAENSEEFFILNFEEETSADNLEIEEVVKPGKVQGNLAEIEALFEDVDTEDASELDQVEDSLHTVSIESITDSDIVDDALANAEFIEIPLDVITTEEEVLVEPQNTKEEVPPKNPIPKTKFSTWSTPKTEFSGFDLIGFNSKGMIEELAIKKTKRTVTETTIVAPVIKKVPAVINKMPAQANDHFEFESDIASETLAKILIIQGHYTKAIVMYQRLSLIFPEKSGLFAVEIKKIENLEDRSAL